MVVVEVVMEEEKRKSMKMASEVPKFEDVIPYPSYDDDDIGFNFSSDYNSTTTFDDLMNVLTTPAALSQPFPSPAPEYSSSISSSSADQPATGNCDLISKKTHEQSDDDDENREKTNEKLSRAAATLKKVVGKKKLKKERGARFAFMTKSEVDHLDDGFRWRKYGQKAVKNSPFPRSYYRCTSTGCGVKKRVERWREEPSIVVTTYEGTHTHTHTLLMLPPPPSFARPGFLMPPHDHHHQLQQQQQAPYVHHNNNFSTLNNSTTLFSHYASPTIQEIRPFRPSARDHGLLEDMLLLPHPIHHP